MDEETMGDVARRDKYGRRQKGIPSLDEKMGQQLNITNLKSNPTVLLNDSKQLRATRNVQK
jgi:hypothetical protein